MRRVALLLFVALVFILRAAWPQGMPLGPEFRVDTYTTSVHAFPSVAADSSGNFVVVWQSDTQDGSSYGVFGQRYSQIVSDRADAFHRGVALPSLKAAVSPSA